jgi:hypothetical protein
MIHTVTSRAKYPAMAVAAVIAVYEAGARRELVTINELKIPKGLRKRHEGRAEGQFSDDLFQGRNDRTDG